VVPANPSRALAGARASEDTGESGGTSMLSDLKRRVCLLNQELPANGLVTMTSGNLSSRDAETDLVVIKPSGVSYAMLTPEDMAVVTLSGEVVDGRLAPSVDTPTHLYIYRHRPEVMGVVHTHSAYATAFAAVGRQIPCALTAIADEFGGAIPVGEYAPIGEEAIGREVCRAIGDSNAILMRQHGVFTIGDSPEAALKAAVMVEDVARTCFLAMQLGTLVELPPEEVARAHRRYVEKYGQRER
jgi:L-ribulose-5-phosphate 4-epimerase